MRSANICRHSHREVLRFPRPDNRGSSHLRGPVLVIGCQAVEANDELFVSLSQALCSPVEPCSLKMTFFRALKNSSILPRTCTYLPLLAMRMSSASLPRQKSKLLICRSLLSPPIPDTMRKCSKRLLHFGHLSGLLKLNFAGGCSGMLAIHVAQIHPTTSDTMWRCHYRIRVGHLYLRLLLKSRNTTLISICFKYWFVP